METQEFFQLLDTQSMNSPRPAIVGADGVLTFKEMLSSVQERAAQYRALSLEAIVSVQDNGASWIISDLAAIAAGVVHLPLSPAATDDQVILALRATGADCLIARRDTAMRWRNHGLHPALALNDTDGLFWRLKTSLHAIPEGTARIVWNNESGDARAAVCLASEAMFAVAASLSRIWRRLGITRHLHAQPLSSLPEAVAGLYASLLAGATCIAMPIDRVGASSAWFDPNLLHQALARYGAHSFGASVDNLADYARFLKQRGERAPENVKYALLDGLIESPAFMELCNTVGLAVVQCHGFPETASVQMLRLPGSGHAGSAGRLLPHATVRLSEDEELEIAGSLYLGYLGGRARAQDWFPTGLLGSVDEDGYVYLSGRKDADTDDSRAPGFKGSIHENIEQALLETGLFAQAVVFEQALVGCCAILWLVVEATTDADIQTAVARASAVAGYDLDVVHWARAKAPYSFVSGMATTHGRPRRTAIMRLHADAFVAAEGGGAS